MWKSVSVFMIIFGFILAYEWVHEPIYVMKLIGHQGSPLLGPKIIASLIPGQLPSKITNPTGQRTPAVPPMKPGPIAKPPSPKPVAVPVPKQVQKLPTGTDPGIFYMPSFPVIWQYNQWDGNTPAQIGNGIGVTYFANSGTMNYPYPNFVGGPNGNGSAGTDALIQPMTFYGGDGTGSNTIGTIGPGQYNVYALQGGSTVGVSIAPRAVDPNPPQCLVNGQPACCTTCGAIVISYWFPVGRQPQPWLGAPNASGTLQVSADMVLPFVYLNSSGGGLIANQGGVIAYFTVVVQNINDGTLLFVAPRILINQFAVGSDTSNIFFTGWYNQPDPITYSSDYGPIIGPMIGNSNVITNCGTSGMNVGSNPYTQTYCFQLHAAGLSFAINQFNQSPLMPRNNYDTIASNYRLVNLNIDMEVFDWTPAVDDRFALSFTNWQASQF